jgi:lipoprotein-releasing system permease protein
MSKVTAPFSRFEWMMALRYLRSPRRQTFVSIIAGLSFLGIALGVATLIIVMAVMNGFRTELIDKILGLNGHIFVHPVGSDLTDYAEVAERISNVEGVIVAMPIIDGQALASGTGQGSGVLVRGVREADLRRVPLIAGSIKTGTLDNFDESEGVLIGNRLAARVALVTDEILTIVQPQGTVTAFGVTPRVQGYPVAGTFQVGMSEYDSSFVFMPLEAAQLFFNKEGQASAIEVYITDPDQVGELREAIEIAAARPVFLADWRGRNQTFFATLEVERNVMFIILTLIILVAAFNIIAGLTMLVKDKSSNIAILRTMGATRGAILRIFFMTGAAIGVLGTLAGFVLGVVVCNNIEAIRQFVSYVTATEIFSPEFYFLSELTARMDASETTSAVLMALIISFLATIIPAWNAARMDPVDALRYE